MINDINNWPELNQLIGICFNEDMLELYPADTFELSVVSAVEFYCKSAGRECVQQARIELANFLSSVYSEAYLEDLIEEMGNSWDFSPYRPFLESVLAQLEKSLRIQPEPRFSK
jgi:hypothetical protein